MIMVKIQEIIPKTQTHPSKLVKPINHLTRPDKNEFEASKYIDHTCHNFSKDSTLEKHVIKISRFDYGLQGPSLEEPCRTKCHYKSTNV